MFLAKYFMLGKPQTIFQLNPHLFIFIVFKNNAWNFYYFGITSWGNVLFGESDLEEDHAEFIMTRGGLHWIYPTSQTAMTESDLKLFRKHGCRWINPEKENTWEHVPEGNPSFRNLLATFHMREQKHTAWNIIFRKKKYLVSTKQAYDSIGCQNTRHLPFKINEKPTLSNLKKIFEVQS